MQVNDLLIAELLETRHGRVVKLRPVNPRTYFGSQAFVDLTLRELDLVVELRSRNQS